ncbi:MAG: TOBE domain-containing protein [Raoultibacter sp.]|jgi:molybdate transport system regulatory protein
MKISARNQFRGVVTAVQGGAVNGVVVIDVAGQTVKSDITMESIKELGLETGVAAIAVIKASNVLIAAASEPIANISARNQFVGTIDKITIGAVNGHVSLALANDSKITASITNAAIEELGLREGQNAVAIVKSTDVMVAID